MVLLEELRRRNIKYQSPIVTDVEYQRATIVDATSKATRKLVIRDYDLDEKGKVRPFIQELLRREGIQTVAIEYGKGGEYCKTRW
jgi:hypothetical protein